MYKLIASVILCLGVQYGFTQNIPRFQIDALAGAVDADITALKHQEEGFTEFHLSPAYQLHASWRFSKRWAFGIHQAFTTFKKTYTYRPGLQETFLGSRYVLQGTITFHYLAREKSQLYSGLRAGQLWNLGKADPGSELFKGGTSQGNIQLVLIGFRLKVWKQLGFLAEVAIGTPTAINAGFSLAIP